MTLYKYSMIKFTLSLSCFFALIAPTVQAEENKETITTADQYIIEYQQFNVDKMVNYYADNVVFIDPTSEIYGKNNFHMEGKKNIVDKFTSLIKSYGQFTLKYDIKQKFETAGYVIYQGILKSSTKNGDNIYSGCGAITTILTFKEGKITEHRDYFDYNGYQRTSKKSDQNCS